MLIMHTLQYAKLDYIFIVKILYKVKASIVVYVTEVLWFPNLFNLISLFQVGFGLQGNILSPAHKTDEDYTVTETTIFNLIFFVVVHYSYIFVKKKKYKWNNTNHMCDLG